MFTKEQIASAALEAGVGVEKIKEMLKLLPEDPNGYSGYANTGDRPALTVSDTIYAQAKISRPINRIKGIYD